MWSPSHVVSDIVGMIYVIYLIQSLCLIHDLLFSKKKILRIIEKKENSPDSQNEGRRKKKINYYSSWASYNTLSPHDYLIITTRHWKHEICGPLQMTLNVRMTSQLVNWKVSTAINAGREKKWQTLFLSYKIEHSFPDTMILAPSKSAVAFHDGYLTDRIIGTWGPP